MKFKRLTLAAWLSAAVLVPVALAAIRTDNLTVTGTSTFSGPVVTSGVTSSGRTTTPAAPNPTASLVGVMMGLAGGITPVSSGRILLLISGDVSNDTANDGASVQCAYGTGTAPLNGAAATGTNVGNPVKLVNGATPTVKIPTLCQGIVTGLTLNTGLWLDVNLAAITGGTATLADVTITAHEF